MSPVLSLEGKTAIVTGGAGGLGLAITDLFLEAGAKVVAIDINTDLVQKFESTHDSSRAIAVEANVTLEEDLEDLFKTTIQKFGQVDIIVNNAGLTDRLGTLLRCCHSVVNPHGASALTENISSVWRIVSRQ